jgi:hypothetical protein
VRVVVEVDQDAWAGGHGSNLPGKARATSGRVGEAGSGSEADL